MIQVQLRDGRAVMIEDIQFRIVGKNAPPEWQDVPGMEHLRDDAPYRVCNVCGRKSWDDDLGEACEMTQPDGSVCSGAFGELVRIEEFTFADIGRIALIDGGYEVHGARYGGMPIRVLKWGDTSDITVEFPMPIDGAREVGEALQAASVVEVARTLPSQIVTPPPR